MGLPPDERQHVRADGQPKDSWPAEWMAETVIRKMTRAGLALRPGCTTLHAYRCQICKQWHIGQA